MLRAYHANIPWHGIYDGIYWLHACQKTEQNGKKRPQTWTTKYMKIAYVAYTHANARKIQIEVRSNRYTIHVPKLWGGFSQEQICGPWWGLFYMLASLAKASYDMIRSPWSRVRSISGLFIYAPCAHPFILDSLSIYQLPDYAWFIGHSNIYWSVDPSFICSFLASSGCLSVFRKHYDSSWVRPGSFPSTRNTSWALSNFINSHSLKPKMDGKIHVKSNLHLQIKESKPCFIYV